MLYIKKTRENFHYVTLAGIYYLKDKFPYFRVLLFYFLKRGGGATYDRKLPNTGLTLHLYMYYKKS